jgi:hypothetical protein
MGKALINSHLGDGRYSITYYRDVTWAEKRMAVLEKLKNDLDLKIYGPNGLSEGMEALQSEIDALLAAFDDALAAWGACVSQMPPCADRASYEQEVNAISKAILEVRGQYAILAAQKAEAKAAQLSAIYEIGYLNSSAKSKEAEVTEAWCCDRHPIAPYTLVGTIETYGVTQDARGGFLPDAKINVYPAYGGTAAYNAARDGKIVPASSNSTAATINNYAQFLYAAITYNPRYASAIVTGKSGDTLTVELRGAALDQMAPSGEIFASGALPVTLTNVTVYYMNCGANAFALGDWVIVKFSGNGMQNPVVIGFASNPKACPQEPVAWRYNSGIYDPVVPTWTATGGTMMTHVWVGYSGLTCSFMGNAAGSTIQYDGGVVTVTGFFVHGACIRDEVEGSPPNETTVRYIYAIVSSTTAIKMVKLNVTTLQSTDLWTVLYSTANESRILREAWFHPDADNFLEAVMPARRAISTTDISAIATMTPSGRTFTDYGSFKGGTNGACGMEYIESSGGNSSVSQGSGFAISWNYIENSNVLIHCRYHPDTGQLCTVTIDIKNGEQMDANPVGDWWCNPPCTDYPGLGTWQQDVGQEWTLTWSVDGSTLTQSKTTHIDIDSRINPYACYINDINESRTYLVHHIDPCYPQHTVYSRSGSRVVRVAADPLNYGAHYAYMKTETRYDGFISVAGQVVVQGTTVSSPTYSMITYWAWTVSICWDGCDPNQFPQTCTPSARTDPATIFAAWPGAKLQVASYKDKFFALFDKPTVTSTGTFNWTGAVSTILSSEFTQSLFVTDTGQTVDHTKTIGAGITTQA